MSTLAVVEQILRETAVPMSVREIVERAGETLPTRSKTPDTVVARDLSMDIKKKGEDSIFIRTAPGRYTIRAIYLAKHPEAAQNRPTEQAAARPQPGNGQPSPQQQAQGTAGQSGEQAPESQEATPVLSRAMQNERAGTVGASSSRTSEERPDNREGSLPA